jgi:hypothetical protein
LRILFYDPNIGILLLCPVYIYITLSDDTVYRFCDVS